MVVPPEIEQEGPICEIPVGGQPIDTEFIIWLQAPGSNDDTRYHEFVDGEVADITIIRVPMIRRIELRADRRLKRVFRYLESDRSIIG